MKTKLIAVIAILLAAVTAASAQQNIKSAFDAIIKCSDAKISRAQTLDQDPQTGIKSGESDVYTFTLPASKMNLVNKVLDAFRKDDSKAYSINSGKATKQSSRIRLAVGDGSGPGVSVNPVDYDYIYALFLAPRPENPDGIYRYAYAFNYRRQKDTIEGHLIITYATTLKHRQEALTGRRVTIVSSSSKAEAEWFDEVMNYVQAMPGVGAQSRISLASRIYSLAKNAGKYPNVTEGDKNTVREVLKVLINDSKYSSDPILRKLLQQSLVELK